MNARLASTAELDVFLSAHSDIQACQLLITDPSGVTRGKSVRRDELAAIYSHGRQVAGSILGLDITGEDVDATGLVWDTGDADLVCRPIADTLTRVPWLAAPTAQLMLTMFTQDGSPAPADPRHALVRAVERLQQRGYTPVLACEIEFYLLRESAAGVLEPAGGGRASERGKIDAYSLQRLNDLAPIFDDIYRAADVQGLPVGTLMSEYAPGQFEVTLRHRADALLAVDEAIQWKRLVRGVAERHGLVATFMAKPFTQRAGSGLHVHVSLNDATGRNVFASEQAEGSESLRHAIGGLQATMPESLAIFAPNANSYRRFVSQSYAPVAPSWGINNRSVSLRVPAGEPASRHVEHRVAGADANLYLTAATVLSGVLAGITEQLDPAPPVVGNGYAQAGTRSLPATWREALDRARASAFLQRALGAECLQIFLAIKEQECTRFSAAVTELDYAWYLRPT
ncbi:MAG TPA: glutamine synthetase family protein [Steroidobacteraceae bacterium]|nr:glutamine synthetase family protein [Steroidobacteraceae bacterium]HRX88202.1 glutamine synthetase family protein [Steroidobacteraceae bacterium]